MEAYVRLCRALGRMLRGARYSSVRVERRNGAVDVRKRRASYAPLFVSLGRPLMAALDTGVRALPQHAWVVRERQVYARLYDASVRIEADGTLVLPYLRGSTLAALLDDESSGAEQRERAITLGVAALADLHARGITHGDAMAENVMVDLESEAARWFDFETVHDAGRSMTWRRADDVRALLATTLLRTPRGEFGRVIALVLDVYADDAIRQPLTDSFTPGYRRALPFHLGQAGLSLEELRDVVRSLRA